MKLRFFSQISGRGLTVLLVLLVMLTPTILLSQELKQEIVDALTSGDTTLAINLLEKEIKLDPSYEYNYFILGEIHYKHKEYVKAEEQFTLALNKNKKFYRGLYALGMVQLKLNKIDEADETFSTGLKKAKNMKGEFHNGLGLVYMAKGMYNEADRELRQAIIEKPDNAEYHINLGDVNFANKIYALAISEYETALGLDTASLEVYFRWAEACLELKDYTCALEKLRIVLSKDSTHAEAWLEAGSIYYKAARSTSTLQEAKQRYLETIGAYKKFVELQSGEPDSATGRAYYESGMSYLILGGYAEANENFRTVLSIPVEPRDIYYYYARSFQGVEQYDSALVYYRRHIDWVKEQGIDYNSLISEQELYRRMGEAYESLKDHYNTIAYYKKSLEYDSTQSRLLYGTAVAYTLVGDYRNALVYYMKRIAQGIDSRYWYVYYNAASAALYLEEKGGLAMEEEEDLETEDEMPAMSGDPDPLEDVHLLELAAEYLEKINVDFWDEIYGNEKNRKTAIKARSMLASTYLYQLSDCANGVAWFEKLLEVDPENCEALKALGYAYFGGICPNNYGRALGNLRKALDCAAAAGGSECDAVDIILWIAQTYHFRAAERREAGQKEESGKDFKLAYDWYLKVLKCDPANEAAKEGRDQVKFEF
ncbi:MAG: tetratricopeptide repeat protein [Candidatus Zixiibacteriota bacterium]|nr:MAG: tetratricopeptide repeat protein [candidate division Zixibacteria bacterium]